MTFTDRLTAGSVRRYLAVVAALAMAIAVVPLVGSADAQTPAEAVVVDDSCNNVPDQGFTDVSEGNPFIDLIDCLAGYGITVGTGDGTTYEPLAGVRRWQMALFIVRYLEIAVPDQVPDTATDQGFTDIGELGAEAQAAVNILAELNVTLGKTATTYDPFSLVRRDQMASFINRAQGVIADEFSTTQDFFTDDEDNVHEDNINALASVGIVQGIGGNQYAPAPSVTRGQMSAFIMRSVEVNVDAGRIESRFPPEAPTNQTFTVTAELATIVSGNQQQVTVTGITSATVDIALAECENVTVTDGTVSFADEENQGAGDDLADFGTVTGAAIVEVDGVAGNFGTSVNNAVVEGDTVNVTIDTTAEDCVVVVVFDDADADDALDLDADNQPTEAFGVSGQISVVAPAQVNASPEFDLNRFDVSHTVTAQVENAAAEAVALADVAVRFTVFRQGTAVIADVGTAGEAENGTGNECADLSNPITLANATTTAQGTANFDYVVSDPSATADNEIGDCIRVQADLDGDGTFEVTDWVVKNWSDAAAAAATLELTPTEDANAVNTQHTVTAAATDQFGDPVDASVTFQVNRQGETNPLLTSTRTTGADGQVTFTYSGPGTQVDDVIVACIDVVDPAATPALAEGCDATVTFDPPSATLNDTELDAFATKFWVTTPETETTVADANVLAFDTAADFVDVEAADDANYRFTYDADDQFSVNGSPAGIADFEAALDTDATLDATFRPGAVSTFNVDAPDVTGPTATVTGATVGATTFTVTFDEAIDPTTVAVTDFICDDTASAGGTTAACPVASFTVAGDNLSATATLSAALEAGDVVGITANSVTDVAGNTGPPGDVTATA